MTAWHAILIPVIMMTAIVPAAFLLLACRSQKGRAHTGRFQPGLLGITLTACLLLASIRLVIMEVVEANLEPVIYQLTPEPDTGVEKPLSSNHPFIAKTTDFLLRPYRWQSLPGTAPYPADNPPTAEKIALGHRLFFDKSLSADRSVSCASCHDIDGRAGVDGERVSTGIGGKVGDKNAPTVWNSAFQRRLFWDGRSTSLEDQALQPMLNPVEMGMASEQAIIARVSSDPRYRQAFQKAFGEQAITIKLITKAIASYERTLVSADSPYDDFVRGDSQALSPQQLSGMVLFEKQGCTLCHYGPNFSASSIFDEGNAFRLFPANPYPSLAKYQLETTAAWRVPSLRNVALTGPWFHNGSVDDLREVVRIMSITQLGKQTSRRFTWSEQKSALSLVENPLLSEQDIDDIVAFLHTLSSKRLRARQDLSAANDIHLAR